MNLVHSHGQAFVRRSKQSAPRDLERVGEHFHGCGIPVEVTDDAVFEPSVRKHVLHTVGKSHHVWADKFCSANIRNVKLRRRTEIHDISDKLHDTPRTASSFEQVPQHGGELSLGQSLLFAVSSGCMVFPAQESDGQCGIKSHVRDSLASYALSQSLADASSAAATPAKNAMSPNNSMFTLPVSERLS